jgi:peroxin-5
MNQNLINVFDQAIKLNQNDPDIYSAMAILFFIKREYNVAIDLFNKALSLDPTNYLLMNKVGATLAHLGRADEAIEHYHKALDIRPNYVRVWVNLGIAYAFKGEYNEAVRFYLNALSFRPDAKHIWSYLHTCFMSLRNFFFKLERYDLINKISSQDIRVFMKDFDILELGQLPEPEIPYKITTEKHILNKLSEDWLNESLGKKM